MTIQISQGILSLVLGIVILVAPKFLNYIVAFWLIINGLIAMGIIRF